MLPDIQESEQLKFGVIKEDEGWKAKVMGTSVIDVLWAKMSGQEGSSSSTSHQYLAPVVLKCFVSVLVVFRQSGKLYFFS